VEGVEKAAYPYTAWTASATKPGKWTPSLHASDATVQGFKCVCQQE